MSTAAEKCGTYQNFNRGGGAQIGQLDYVENDPMPNYIPIGGSLTTYQQLYSDINHDPPYYTLYVAAAWNKSAPTYVPNVVNLARYIGDAGTVSEVLSVTGASSYTTIDEMLSAGQLTYDAGTHQYSWMDMCAWLDGKVSWVWGSLKEGGCGILNYNNTHAVFLGTYGTYNNEAGTDQRIAATMSNPIAMSDLLSCCLYVPYWKQRDSFGSAIDVMVSLGSEVTYYTDPQTVALWTGNIIYTKLYGSMSDILDNTTVGFGTGEVYNTLIDVGSVSTPYNNENSIFWPETIIDIDGYSLTQGSPDTGNEEPYSRGDGGGDNDGSGDYNNASDDVEGADDDMFTVDAQSCGFVTVYKVPKSTLQSFASWLYGELPSDYGSFLDTIKKLQLNPMDGIISLNLAHYDATAGGAEPIGFYGMDSGFSAPVVSSLTKTENCGTIYLNEVIGGWMSYGNMCNVKVYLPYCGTFSLATNEVMGGALELKYIIDVLTGACVAEIKVIRNRSGENGVVNDPSLSAPIYRFTGNIFQQVPISAVDYSGIINAQLGLAAGAATFASGNMLGGATQMFNSAIAAPKVERIGSAGASYGYMSSQQPFVMVEYPWYNDPSAYANYYGEPIYEYVSRLGDYDGYTEVDPTKIWFDNHEVEYTEQLTSEEENMLRDILNRDGIYIEHNTRYSNYEP